jgi:hypothetical protein
MEEFFWKFSSFDPKYVSLSNSLTKRVFTLTGVVLFTLVCCSFVSYTYVGFLLSDNIFEAVLVGGIFAFFLLNFYRMALLTFSWFSHKDQKQQNPKFNSLFIKLVFMTMNILFFVYTLELIIFKDTLQEYIIQENAVDGIVTRIKLMTSHIPLSHVLTFLFLVFFLWPLLGRYFVKKYGSDYDELKAKDEAGIIKNHFATFLADYKYTINDLSEGKADGIIFDMMIDPPFNTHFKTKSISTVSEEELFSYLEGGKI